MDDEEDGLDAVYAGLRALREDVDARAETLARLHSDRLQCRRGCADCCQDELRVSAVEAAAIRAAHADLLARGEPGAKGGCAFLDGQRACRIYAERPLVCRTQGLPLRVFFETDSEEIVEQRDICPLNEPGEPPLESLEADACWLVGPDELRLFSINEAYCGDGDRRVSLRSLFTRRGLASRDR